MLDPARPVRDVSVGGGLLVAGGDALHMLRPGAVRPALRELPQDAGLAAVAVEPWAPFRYAIAARGLLQIFSGRDPDERLFELGFTEQKAEPTHLAWTRHGGETMLYLRGRDSKLRRFRPGLPAIEELESPPIAAIAADASGVLATIDVLGDQDACISRDGTGWDCRPLTTIPVADGDDDLHIRLAVSGGAIAYSVDGMGTYVSWAPGAEFERCDGLMWGPIAFHGDDALLCAYSVEATSRVARRTRQGETTLIFELETAWTPDAAMEISAIAWDASRRTLWGASPGAGLLMAKQPGAGGAKGLILN
jgi:hypothetical protein